MNHDVIATREWIINHLHDPAVSLIDARTPDFYSREGLGNASRPGHLPGASNLPFTEMVDDSLMFKPIARLRELFDQSEMKGNRTEVTYCHIGQQASLVYFAARLLGYEARMYDGSAQEWSRDESLPMVVKAEGP